MVKIGCTGGIGSGKSTVTTLLAEHGARVIDVDSISHRITAEGGPAYAQIVETFGPTILNHEGAIDRHRLADIVFRDPARRRILEDIVHPRVSESIELELAGSREEIIVLDHPLLVETDARQRFALDGVIVVDTPIDLVIARLVDHRGMTPDEAHARIAAQSSREERLQAADFIVMNMGTREELVAMAENAWEWIQTLIRTDES